MRRICSLLLYLVTLHVPFVYADCETDIAGVVFCSAYPAGGAMLTRSGGVECGKGQCRKDSFGQVQCSKMQGGGAGIDRQGAVKCLGGCERGSIAMCEEGVK